ncbi:MAG: bifunctional diaminohydroxyphosphoribosylaminopyrimidine deaminase/5-amino-6-(5-phosphoribosylamino)uracil reductase RibD [Acidobacteria bacterium]|nr:bifunctional diaminohydroxyphosphoribosylaminopyrimidine deaminase/5-amino-6-(5-phosphoribosylamino)uracil reductase RibD [Acidobacteriota bacterium]
MMREDFMRRALQLAERARGRTSPNPMVGAVLVREGRIVGEGIHPQAGEPHAEIFALRQAGEAARGATLYVNLEPCCHFGRTPPCTQALIAAGIAEVHMAMLDPNPLVAGQGRESLEAAGIRTVVGECEAEAQCLNEVFVHWITTGRPFVIAKFAMSLDGKIATRRGDSRWITGPAARQHVHELRDQVDAILVGANTVIADDPQLTTRLDKEDVRHPLRIILDSRGRTPLTAQVFDSTLPGHTLVATTPAMPARRRQVLEKRGIEVLVLSAEDGRVSLSALLTVLGRREIASLLVEGGGTVLGAFFAQGLVNKVCAFIAPLIIGGCHAMTPVGGIGVDRLADALRLERVELQQLGTDVLIGGYPVLSVDRGSWIVDRVTNHESRITNHEPRAMDNGQEVEEVCLAGSLKK